MVLKKGEFKEGDNLPFRTDAIVHTENRAGHLLVYWDG